MKSADNIPGVGSLVEVEGDKPLKLGALIKSGGAGSIYQLPEAPELVAKIYHAGIDLVEYEHKVRAMLRLVPDLPDLEENGVRMPQIAWPSALLRDQAGGFCGFLMPRLDIDTTIELEYMLQERQARAAGLPTGLGPRLTLAANLSSLIVALHRQKHYVVDLKPVNIRFYRHALYLAVLDCDGFSIDGEGERYPAPQYTPDYLAPEFHKTGLQPNAEEQQDRFALAVIIFQLLNFGIHPYAGSPLNDQVPTDIPGRIAGCYYAYALRPHSGIRPNPASGHKHFPPQLRELFDRAFGGGDAPRPSAAEWAEALAPYARKSTGQLVVCQNDKEHQHFAGQECAACARNAFMAKVVSAQELMAGSQQQATVAKAGKVATPASAPVPPPKPAHLPKHTTPASSALSAVYKTMIVLIALPIMALLAYWGLPQLFSMLSDSFSSSRPEEVTANCKRRLPEAREVPEIGSLLALVQPSDCYIRRLTIPAGEILAAPGSSLYVDKGFKPNMGLAANLAMLASAKKILVAAGWQELATYPDNGNAKELRAEFRRLLPDQTRQYFHLETNDRIRLKMVTLPTPRLNLSLPKPETLASQYQKVADRFSELPPLPGLEYKGLSYFDGEPQYVPADPKLGRPAYNWNELMWVRTYRYDPAKISAFAAARLYSDALRDAGWLVQKDYSNGYMPDHVTAHMSNQNRELIATLSFSRSNETDISLNDIGFQRKVAAIIMQWGLNCEAVIPGLDFATGQSTLSESTMLALETLAEARDVNQSGVRVWHHKSRWWGGGGVARADDGNSQASRLSEPIALEIRGRGDATGSRAQNLKLAKARAEAVKAWLVEKRVPPDTLSISAFGDLKSDETSEGLPSRTVTVAKLGCSPKKP